MIGFIFKNSQIKILLFTNVEYSEDEKKTIIKEFYETPLGGHQGVSRTMKRIKQHHTWKGLKAGVKEYIKPVKRTRVIIIVFNNLWSLLLQQREHLKKIV